MKEQARFPFEICNKSFNFTSGFERTSLEWQVALNETANKIPL